MENGLADAKSFSLPWVGRQAHDNSGQDDKFVVRSTAVDWEAEWRDLQFSQCEVASRSSRYCGLRLWRMGCSVDAASLMKNAAAASPLHGSSVTPV
jgi:hypothetical protein